MPPHTENMVKEYANPPIMEVICEFRLTRDSNWDLTIPGIIYEKVKDEFSNKEQKFIQIPPNLPDNPHSFDLIRFLTDNRKMFIQVAPHILAVNCLKPYPSWKRFRPQITKAFQALVESIDVKGFQRIGLRYVNHIEIHGQEIKLDKYFNFRPFLGEKLPQQMSNFFVGCVLPFEESDACKIEFINEDVKDPNQQSFFLDLDYHYSKKDSISKDQALKWVDKAHEQIQQVFEGCITDDLRKLFNEVS